MRLRRRLGLTGQVAALSRRLGLTGQVAALSLVAIVVLGFVLARVLQAQVVDRALTDASESARLVARVGIQPYLSPKTLTDGLDREDVRRLDRALRTPQVRSQLARVKIWNTDHVVVYSDDHSLIGRTFAPEDDDLDNALAGHAGKAAIVTPERGTETASEVGLGRLVEVYIPLRFPGAPRPSGAFEIYLSYRPIAAAISSDKRMIVLIVSLGLVLLWGVLYRIVAAASRKLRRIATENDRLARYDVLTGLPNRTLLIERIERALRDESEGTRRLALLLTDIDGFKEVNDTLGHANGDRALEAIADRLRDVAPPGATVARLGADEYGVLAPGVGDPSAALDIALEAHRMLEDAIVLDGVAINLDISVGIALAPADARSATRLMQCADVALDVSRRRHSRAEVYSPQEDRFDAERLALLGQVRAGLQEDAFVLHYQPKIDLASGECRGVEALVRWQHGELGLLAPGRFMAAVEQTALIRPLTERILELAIAQAAEWRGGGLSIPISVNLSARNLLDESLPERVRELLLAEGVEPAQLTVEVTESATVTDPQRATSILQAFRELGIGVSIDDFGTGHASFAYLAELPATELKIDRSFVAGMATNATDEAIVRSTVELARQLDLDLVAEGIESEGERDRLLELGCRTGQGYLIARPMDASQATAWLRQQGDSRGRCASLPASSG